MTLALAAAVAVVSGFLVERLGLPTHVRAVMSRAGRCRRILADRGRTDLEKERALREETVRLLGLFGRLAGGSLVAIGVPLAAIGALQAVGVASASAVVATMIRPAFLASAFGVGVLVWAWRRKAGR